jgi:hypothetical protein
VQLQSGLRQQFATFTSGLTIVGHIVGGALLVLASDGVVPD